MASVTVGCVVGVIVVDPALGACVIGIITDVTGDSVGSAVVVMVGGVVMPSVMSMITSSGLFVVSVFEFIICGMRTVVVVSIVGATVVGFSTTIILLMLVMPIGLGMSPGIFTISC